MRIYYDFHIHTILSPCGDDDMTPNNIVNMAMLNELDCIAITDHNTWGNIPAVLEVAADAGLVVVPGMEVETAEEIHVVCLFPDLESVSAFGKVIESRLPKIKNKPEIFGRQLFLDAEDEIIGEYENLLLVATSIDINELINLAGEHGGLAIPAHVDRSSYSVLSNLGFMPDDLDVRFVELSKVCNFQDFISENKNKMPKDYQYISSSDAHYLGDINERVNFLEISQTDFKLTAQSIINFMKEARQ